jgi:hypothetical protein
MNHSKQIILSGGAVLLGLFMACAKQTSEDDTNDAGVGSGASIFQGGAGSGTGSNTSTGSTSSGNILPGASTTVDGTIPVDVNAVTEVLNNPDTACQGSAVEAEAEPALLLFLVDVSGSMNLTSPTTKGQTKWVVTRDSLKTSIQGLPSTYGIGLKYYPNMAIVQELTNARDPSACVNSSNDVALALATDAQQSTVAAALDGIAPNDKGATPTHDAYKLAVEELANSTLPITRRYIVFITDGQPTQSEGCIGKGVMCEPSPTDPIIASIEQAWTDHQIKTFVVGSPGSEKNECTSADVRDWLSKAARAGQTQPAEGCSDTAAPYCHFDLSQAADFGTAMSDALRKITASVLSCLYGVPAADAGKTLDPNLVNMFFSDGLGNYKQLLPDDLGTCEKGWSYTDSTKTSVQICGETCKLLQESSQASLQILFGCVPRTWIQ